MNSTNVESERFRFSYATMASPQYLLLVFFLFGGSVLILNIHAQPPGFDPNFSALVTRIFNEFREAALHAGRNQFAVVVMITPQQMENWDVQFHPQDAGGHPLIESDHSLSPHQEANYYNFIVATPDRHNVHSEQQILPHIEQLQRRFLEAHSRLGAIILYTYYAPCEDCTNQIIQSLRDIARDVATAVLFSSSLRGVNESYARQEILGAGMDFARFDNCRHDVKRRDAKVMSAHDAVTDNCKCVSLQDYLLCRLEEKIDCCVASSSRKAASADFINRIMAECSSKLTKLNSCSREAVFKLHGGACGCLNRDPTANLVSYYIEEAMTSTEEIGGIVHYIARPFNPEQVQPSEPVSFPEDLKGFTPASFPCTDQRKEGVLCSSWKKQYITAGNSICRANHPCDYHGEKYSWCYVDSDDNWEYCCTGKCGYNGDYEYTWCNSGSKWEYCGYYDLGDGLKNVNAEHCLLNHPCGKHGYYSNKYWCYSDANKNWDYCCAPGEICYRNRCNIGDWNLYYVPADSCKY